MTDIYFVFLSFLVSSYYFSDVGLLWWIFSREKDMSLNKSNGRQEILPRSHFWGISFVTLWPASLPEHLLPEQLNDHIFKCTYGWQHKSSIESIKKASSLSRCFAWQTRSIIQLGEEIVCFSSACWPLNHGWQLNKPLSGKTHCSHD